MNRINLNPQEIKNNLYLLFESALKTTIKSLFNDIEKKIFLRAEHSEDPHIKSNLLNQIELIKNENSKFEQIFFNLITENRAKQTEINWLDVTGDRNLALQIEDIITQAKAKYGVEHAQFESRINWLFNCFPEHFSGKIFTLQFLILNFLESSKILSSPLKDQAVRSLGNQVLYKLEPLYILMNENLIQYGVISEVKSPKKTIQSSHTKSLIETLDSNEHLFNKELEESAFIPTSYIINFIQHCIENKYLILTKKSDWSSDGFVKNFIKNLESFKKIESTNGNLTNEDYDTLERLGAFLSALINKKAINPIIKNKVIEMQNALMMTAFSCSKFMQQPSHSARLSLVKISSIGMNSLLSLSTLNETANIIGNFIDKFSIYNELDFIDLNTSLDEIILKVKSSELTSLIPAQVKELKEIKEITQRYPDLVTEIIRKKTEDSILSTQARTLINSTLTRFLIDTLIRYGRQAPAWKDANSLLDLIIELEARLKNNNQIPKLNIEPIINLIEKIKRENTLLDFSKDIATISYIDYILNLNTGITCADFTASTHHLAQNESVRLGGSELTTAQPLFSTQSSILEKTETAIHSGVDRGFLANLDDTSKDSSPPSEFLLNTNTLINHPSITLFTTKHILNNEWFKVFVAPELPLRTLKPFKIDRALSRIIFSNKNDVSTLSLPIDQFYQDTFNNRSHPVFETENYAHDLTKLMFELKKQGLIL